MSDKNTTFRQLPLLVGKYKNPLGKANNSSSIFLIVQVTNNRCLISCARPIKLILAHPSWIRRDPHTDSRWISCGLDSTMGFRLYLDDECSQVFSLLTNVFNPYSTKIAQKSFIPLLQGKSII